MTVGGYEAMVTRASWKPGARQARHHADTVTPWKNFALKALEQWLKQDWPGHQALHRGDKDGVRRWMAYYRIARNYRNLPEIADCLVQVTQDLSLSIPDINSTDRDLVACVEELSVAFGNQTLVSAASKLIYLAKPEVGVILDGHVRRALKMPEGCSYAEFVAAWNQAFLKARPFIRKSLKELSLLDDELLPFHLANVRTCKQLLSSRWFARRVFDIYC